MTRVSIALSVAVILVFGVETADAAMPVVSNVTANQRDGTIGAGTIVDITYDVEDVDSDSVEITVQVSADGGNTFDVPAETFTGDVGRVEVGLGKAVEWQAGVDVPDVYWPECQVKATAEDIPAFWVVVPVGTFDMGSVDIDEDEEPEHSVTLSTFYMDINEVTVGQYVQFLNSGGQDAHYNVLMANTTHCGISKLGDGDYNVASGRENFPVVYVNWDDAKTYCEWAGKRLPTEAEWEYAAGGTDGRTHPWGEGIDPTKANYGENVGGSTEVGSYPAGASPFGCLDMAGNVGEWVWDWFEIPYPSTPQTNPTGPVTGTERVMRGGGWTSVPYSLRVTQRFGLDPTIRSLIGFRCVRTP